MRVTEVYDTFTEHAKWHKSFFWWILSKQSVFMIKIRTNICQWSQKNLLFFFYCELFFFWLQWQIFVPLSLCFLCRFSQTARFDFNQWFRVRFVMMMMMMMTVCTLWFGVSVSLLLWPSLSVCPVCWSSDVLKWWGSPDLQPLELKKRRSPDRD